MTRVINTLGDRLLGLVAPRVTASAGPCANEHYEYRCYNGYYQRRFCCGSTCNNWVTLYWGC